MSQQAAPSRRGWRGFASDLGSILTPVTNLVVLACLVIYGLQMFRCAEAKGIAVFSYPTPACLDQKALLSPPPTKKGTK